MKQQTLSFIRNSIFTVTATLAVVIVTLPSGANELTTAQKLGVFSGLVETTDYNPSLVQHDLDAGERYRTNSAFRVQSELQPRSVFSVQFDQKNLFPLAASTSRKNSLKRRNDIEFDRDRSLLADYRLTGN